jgi:predicted regulator of Ras-like GTPase activity (Roadblock/LC7/MglB family)
MLNLQDVERDLDNLHRVQLELDRIVTEAGALGDFMVDENGFLIAESGAIDIDRVALSALVAASFGATAEIARILGEADFNRIIHQGSTRQLFIGKAGSRHILIVVFGKDTNLGLVKLYAERVAANIGLIMDSSAEPEPIGSPDGTPPAATQPGGEETGSGLFPTWMDNKE